MNNTVSLRRPDSRRHRFEALMRPRFDGLYAAARRLTRSPHDAEDLVQEVCVKAFVRLEELERIEYPQAWLLKVLYHQFIDGQRCSARSPISMASTGTGKEEPNLTTDGAAQPYEQVEHDQRLERIQRAMCLLDPEQCALVVMHDVEGYSIADLSKLNDVPSGTIKARLHRTRAKLGRLLASGAVPARNLKIAGDKK